MRGGETERQLPAYTKQKKWWFSRERGLVRGAQVREERGSAPTEAPIPLVPGRQSGLAPLRQLPPQTVCL